jgi:Leucine-rich repeat (LRR) protein
MSKRPLSFFDDLSEDILHIIIRWVAGYGDAENLVNVRAMHCVSRKWRKCVEITVPSSYWKILEKDAKPSLKAIMDRVFKALDANQKEHPSCLQRFHALTHAFADLGENFSKDRENPKSRQYSLVTSPFTDARMQQFCFKYSYLPTKKCDTLKSPESMIISVISPDCYLTKENDLSGSFKQLWQAIETQLDFQGGTPPISIEDKRAWLNTAEGERQVGLLDLPFDDDGEEMRWLNFNLLPPELAKFTGVRHLDLSWSGLWTFPEIISDNLSLLESLIFMDSSMEEIPDSIGKLVNLNELSLVNTRINHVSSICKLTRLRILELKEARDLSSIPDAIGQLTQLKMLCLPSNQIRRLPHSIGSCVNLRELDIGDNQLTSIPTSIGNLVYLRQLSLRYHQLTHLPHSISRLANLKRLDLSHNRLTSIPDETALLISLKELKINNNFITTIPASLILDAENSKLEDVQLDHNPSLLFMLSGCFKASNTDPSLPEIRERYQTFSNYLCKTPLARLYQDIHRPIDLEGLQERFEQLCEDMQQLISIKMQEGISFASVRSFNIWTDFFSYKTRLATVLIDIAKEKLSQLPLDRRGEVDQLARVLAHPSTPNAGVYLVDSAIYKIDAMEMLTPTSSGSEEPAQKRRRVKAEEDGL